mmetsp:Transcript_36136/g.82352  ORF Transcript_36136/g.82352 Transcript_36136/m.82352 type:complete len:371 (-) Transcript_36136:905-2017(-)
MADDTVKTIIALACRRSAAATAASAVALRNEVVKAKGLGLALLQPERRSRSMPTSASTHIFAMNWTDSTGYLPCATSPLSITASVPSNTALATSDTSARVGLADVSIDSSICVAVMTGFPAIVHFRIRLFCMSGTCSRGHSTPRSPRATMMQSDASMIASMSAIACGFSIFDTRAGPMYRHSSWVQARVEDADSVGWAARYRLQCSRSSTTSAAFWTKESAIYSTSLARQHSASLLSLSVNALIPKSSSGTLIPFFSPSMPPFTTTTPSSRSPRRCSTRRDIAPSARRTRSPGLRRLNIGANFVVMVVALPGSSEHTSRMLLNCLSSIGRCPSVSPVRILGPHRSPRTATGTPKSVAVLRISAIAAVAYS